MALRAVSNVSDTDAKRWTLVESFAFNNEMSRVREA